VENGLAAAIEREQKLSEQIISADEVIRGMERDSESLQEQLTKVTEAYRMSCPLSEKVELAARCEAAEKQVMSLETEARRALESEAIARVELEDLVKRYEVLQKESSDESTRLRSDLRLKETRLLSKAGALEEKVGFRV
jgi:DNA-binding sugar fermentation-stimulating protein